MNQTVSKSFLLYVLAAASIFSIAESRNHEEILEDLDLRDPPSSSSDEGDSDHHRIVGGDEATPGDYPYFVELGGCGGALIAPDIVLFAAHCKDKFLNRQFNIGAYKSRSTDEGAQQRFCDKWLADPQYKQGGSGINNDFALCKLDHPVEMDSNISLELNEEDTVPSVGEDLLVMGFGRTKENGNSASKLRDVVVPYISNEKCNAPESYNGKVTDHMLCAGFPEGGKDACQGDSGGPIVKRRINEDGTITDIHVGVVSWGSGCARADKPGVYARTSSRVDWIKSASCEQFNSVASWCTDPQPEPRCKGEDLEVDVLTDYYGYETTWQLEDTLGHILKYRKFRVSDAESHTKVCLNYDTCYKWKITDAYGDGMCTNKGCGSYTVKKDGEVITTSTKPKFGKEETVDFCTGPAPISEAPSQAPSQAPSASPTKAPSQAPSQAPSASPTEACGGNDSLKYQIQLHTDNFGDETIIATYKIDQDSNGVLVFEETNLASNTLHTFPSEESYQCLEDNHCYLFAIGDSNGDGMTVGDGAFFKGLINGEEIFAGGADFEEYDERIFCVGDATLSPTVAPTASPTVTPTSNPTATPTANPTVSPTANPTANPTVHPTSAPTSSPTASPTALQQPNNPINDPADEEESAAPTSAPTASLTAAPTASPTANPTANPTASPTAPVPVCHDDQLFRWGGKKKLNCKRFIRGKKAHKRCEKVWAGIPVTEWCAHSCGSKAGLGACPNLLAEKKARKRAKQKENVFKHLFEKP